MGGQAVILAMADVMTDGVTGEGRGGGAGIQALAERTDGAKVVGVGTGFGHGVLLTV